MLSACASTGQEQFCISTAFLPLTCREEGFGLGNAARDSRDGFGVLAALAAPPAGLDGDRRLPRAHEGAALPVHAHRCLDDGGRPVPPPVPRVLAGRHAPRPGLFAREAKHSESRMSMPAHMAPTAVEQPRIVRIYSVKAQGDGDSGSE